MTPTRSALFLSTLASAALLLTACSGAAPSTGDDSTSTTNAPNAPTTTEDSPKAAEASGPDMSKFPEAVKDWDYPSSMEEQESPEACALWADGSDQGYIQFTRYNSVQEWHADPLVADWFEGMDQHSVHAETLQRHVDSLEDPGNLDMDEFKRFTTVMVYGDWTCE